jgi:hypothetical protein
MRGQGPCRERCYKPVRTLEMRFAIFICFHLLWTTMMLFLHSEGGRREFCLQTWITLLGLLMVQRPHFQLKVTAHENFHAGAVYTGDIIKLTTFCVVYEIRFPTLFNHASESYHLDIGSPFIFDNICVYLIGLYTALKSHSHNGCSECYVMTLYHIKRL